MVDRLPGTGGHRHQLPVLGTFPWEVASCLGCWVSWAWSWWHGWELGTTVWAHPILPSGSGRVWGVPSAGGWDEQGLGALGVTALTCSPCTSHRTVSNLFLERGTEVAMPSPGGGRCALLLVPVPVLCRSGAAAPSSSSSYGRHPQILQMASGQELLLGQAVRSLAV